ncbi:MAG: hypothetical protein JRD84_09395 [Deltaproteobacteria bacterium]|nr:hypothetical protein [Deltaproteobacteria bacterium]
MIPIRAMKILCASMVLLGAGLILLSLNFGMQTASANTQYGILGQQAPGLELDTWIDGNGKPMDPVKLTDYRGKVIYLYFFQDW